MPKNKLLIVHIFVLIVGCIFSLLSPSRPLFLIVTLMANVSSGPPPINKRTNATDSAQKTNHPSLLLTPDENQLVYTLLGKRCFVSIMSIILLQCTLCHCTLTPSESLKMTMIPLHCTHHHHSISLM